jgi:flagellar biosynthesis GTPase FlhF
VAFVGAAGAGKTRCAAALAAAYAGHSTLAATVVSLSGGSHGNDVAALLGGREVRAEVKAGQTAVDTVARYRDGGMVIIDTVGVSPVDHAGIQSLSEALKAFELDAVYLTVPATLSASAARGLLDRLSPLAPTALVITHADEIEELGIVTELAYLSGLPIAFVHGGLAVDTALSLADPARVAARLLP